MRLVIFLVYHLYLLCLVDECSQPAAPLLPDGMSGSVTCNRSIDPFIQCTPDCGDGFAFSVPTPEFYTCGPSGSFNVDNMFLGFKFPTCASKAD